MIRIIAQGQPLLPELVAWVRRRSNQRLWIVVPTTRLAHLLEAYLGEEPGKPQRTLLTLHQFLGRLAPVPGREATPLEEEMIVASVARRYPELRIFPQVERELRVHFRDLISQRTETEWFERVQQSLASQVHRAPAVATRHLAQLRSVEDCRRQFVSLLTSCGLIFSPEAERRRCDQVRQSWEATPLPHVEAIAVAGFTSVAPAVRELFQHLARDPRVDLWIYPPRSGDTTSGLALLAARLEQPPPDSLPEPRANPHHVHLCDSQWSQIGTCLNLIETYLQEGVAPDNIAVLFPRETPYRDMLPLQLAAVPWPYNFALPASLARTPIGRWVMLIGDVWQERIRGHVPPAAKLRQLGRIRRLADCWQQALRTAAPPGAAQLRAWLPDPDVPYAEIATSCAAFEALWFAPTRRPWAQSIGSWLAEAFAAEVDSAAPPQQAGWHAFFELLDMLRRLETAGLLGCDSAAEFWQLLSEKIRAVSCHSVGYPVGGVQFLRYAEARSLPFQVLIIFDVVDGILPPAPPRDHVLSDRTKRACGLPGWGYVEAMEHAHFELYLAAAEHVHCLVPARLLGRPTEPSGWLDQRFRTYPSHAIPALKGIGQPITARQRNVSFCPATPASHLSLPIGSQLSVTDLEALVQCPLRFALRRAAVSSPPNTTLQQLADVGDILHDLVARFFATPLPGFSGLEAWRSFAVERFAQLLSEGAAPAPSVLRQWHWVMRPRWTEWIASEVLGGSRFVPEQALACSQVLGSSSGLELRGRVDLVISRPNGTVVLVDYKRRSIPRLKEVVDLSHLQLLFYAWAISTHSSMPLEQLEIVYYSLWDGSLTRLSGSQLESAVAGARLRANAALRAVTEGKSSWQPVPGPYCRRCAYPRVCGVAQPWLQRSYGGSKNS